MGITKSLIPLFTIDLVAVSGSMMATSCRNHREQSMSQNITKSAATLVAEARAVIKEYTAQEAMALAQRPDVALVDIRDPRELEREGKIPGALHCPRGMLEFWIDPQSPYYKPQFGDDKTYVFFCAGGMRSVLATKVAQDMGMKPVAHIIGGFAAWRAAGGAIETVKPKD
jgi:rhodanese-related sulfurtransferase